MKPGARQYAPKDSPEVRAKFLDQLREGLTVKDAAAAVGIPRRTIAFWREEDPEFAKQWEEAYDEGTDVLEREAQRRAVEGVEKPVYQGGVLVGHVQEYSDTLMNILLQGRRPNKYRKSSVELSGPNGGPIQATMEIEYVSNDKDKK